MLFDNLKEATPKAHSGRRPNGFWIYGSLVSAYDGTCADVETARIASYEIREVITFLPTDLIGFM